MTMGPLDRFYTNAARTDPTNTTMVQLAFERDLLRRLRRVKSEIRQKLAGDTLLRTNAPARPLPRSGLEGPENFLRDPRKADEFMEWLDRMARDNILEATRGTPVHRAAQTAWSNVYVQSAYQKGLQNAARAMSAGGAQIADNWVESGFYRRIHADRIGLIYVRAYHALDSVTEAMGVDMSRVLAQAMSEGVGLEEVGRRLSTVVDTLGLKRSRVIARTEVVNAHAEGTLNSYEEAGVEGVKVQAEFITARDNKVCPKCEALEGETLTVKEARGKIPVHPNCRCAWLPAVLNMKGVRLGT